MSGKNKFPTPGAHDHAYQKTDYGAGKIETVACYIMQGIEQVAFIIHTIEKKCDQTDSYSQLK
jgi:hypothetical protein